MKFDYSNPPSFPGDNTNVAAWLRLNDFPYEIVDATLWHIWYTDMPDPDLLYDEEYRIGAVFAPNPWGSYWIHDGLTQIVVHATIDPSISEGGNGYSVMEKAIYSWIRERNAEESGIRPFGIIEARPGDDEPGQEPHEAVIFMDVQLGSMGAALKYFKSMEKLPLLKKGL